MNIIAVENLDEILTVDHIDVFFVAPGDLGQSMSLRGQSGPGEVQKVVDATIQKIVAEGRTAGAIVSSSSAKHHRDLGARFLLTGSSGWIAEGLAEMNRRAKA